MAAPPPAPARETAPPPRAFPMIPHNIFDDHNEVKSGPVFSVLGTNATSSSVVEGIRVFHSRQNVLQLHHPCQVESYVGIVLGAEVLLDLLVLGAVVAVVMVLDLFIDEAHRRLQFAANSVQLIFHGCKMSSSSISISKSSPIHIIPVKNAYADIGLDFEIDDMELEDIFTGMKNPDALRQMMMMLRWYRVCTNNTGQDWPQRHHHELDGETVCPPTAFMMR